MKSLYCLNSSKSKAVVALTAVVILMGVAVITDTIFFPKNTYPNFETKSVNTALSVEDFSSHDSDTNLPNIDLAKSGDQYRDALMNYFAYLNAKRYDDALKYHGSGFEGLYEWNPEANRNDYAGLIKAGCEINGWQCLKIKNVLKKITIADEEFKFLVQFNNNDGTLFKSGPCCGATKKEMPTVTSFEYTVKKVDGNYLVITLPPYRP